MVGRMIRIAVIIIGSYLELLAGLFTREGGAVKKHHIYEEGIITAIGWNSVIVPLPIKQEARKLHVKVEFLDPCIPINCNPHHHDELDWEIRKDHQTHQNELHIHWHVSGIRQIKWTVRYER